MRKKPTKLKKPPVVIVQRVVGPLREHTCAEYKRHLEAAKQLGETCSCIDINYLTTLLDNVIEDIKWPNKKLTDGADGNV